VSEPPPPGAGFVRLAEGVMAQDAADEAVLMDLGRGTYYALNAVGARVLAWARALPSADAVVERLAEEYEADTEVLRRDVERLLSELESQELITVDRGGWTVPPVAGGE